jgi:probable HAF family extracellular repeat protein
MAGRIWGQLPGGKNSLADAINNPGLMVGLATTAKFPNGVAVYWDTSGKIHKIGTLAGGTFSYAGFVNDLGQVVGESTVSGGDSHAFVWTPKTGLRDLNKLIPSNSGWVLNHASAINRTGQIVGYGTINGANHGFLLTP